MVKEFLQRLFNTQKPDDNFDIGSGDQQLVHPTLLLNAEKFAIGLRQEEKLILYKAIYYSNPLGMAAVSTLTNLVNTQIVGKSGDAESDQRMKEVWADIDGGCINDQLLKNANKYGYAVGEIVAPGMEYIDRVVVPDSPNIRFHLDRYGQTKYIRQTTYRMSDGSKGLIPAAKFVIFRRDPASQWDAYGASIYESSVQYYENVARILDAQIKIYMRIGRPRYHIQVPSQGLTVEQFKDRLTKTKAAIRNLGDDKTTDVYSPESVEIKIIGAEGWGIKFAEETRLQLQAIMASAGLPPALLHITTQAPGAESYLRQVIVSLQSQLVAQQNAIAAAWNKSFWPLVAKIERLKTVPVMAFQKPRLLEQLIEEEAREKKFENDKREVQHGIRSPEWLSQQCGQAKPFDPKLLKQKSTEDTEEKEGTMPNSIKASSTTKVTDIRATKNTELSKCY